MKNLVSILGLVIFSILFIGCSTSDDTVEPVPDLRQTLQEAIDSKVGEDDKFKGVSVSIRFQNGDHLSLAGGISKPDLPIDQSMKFGTGSITKTSVAAAILKLEDQGLLSTDDTIGDWLALDNQNIDESITIFQLLNHSSGVKDYLLDPNFWPTIESDFENAIPHTDLANFIGEPLFAPGEGFRYSNSNYILLGLIIRSVTGKEVGQVLRELFWQPLGLNNIFFGSDENVPEPIANPWRDNDGNGTLDDISSQWGAAYHSAFYTAADLFSTSTDLSSWAQLLYSGKVLSNESLAKMTTFVDYNTGNELDGNGYGLGVIRLNYRGHLLWGHTGGMRGYGGNSMFYDTTTGMSIAILINQSRGVNDLGLSDQLFTELLDIVFAVE